MADYAQSPYAGIRYFENVQRTLGKEKTAAFARLYTAPGVDHVGSGAPANVDMLSVLVDWVENGKVPGDLEVTEQKVEAPAFETTRALPLCQWPAWPHYKSGPSIARRVLLARRKSYAPFYPRHCERCEAIHRTAIVNMDASSLSLLAMTELDRFTDPQDEGLSSYGVKSYPVTLLEPCVISRAARWSRA